MRKIKKDTIRSTLFGLTQLEIAALLNVTRSQWSHYEATTRNLPSPAGTRVAEMVVYMCLPEAKDPKNLSLPEYEDKNTKPILEKRIKENEYQLLLINRKIDKVQEKFERYEKAVQLMVFLNSPEQVKKATVPQILLSTTDCAIINYKNTKSELRLLKIDRELLELQQQCLQKGLGISIASTSTGSV